MRLNDLLGLPLGLQGSLAGHRYPQAQDSQQQRHRPGARTPEHLESVRGWRDPPKLQQARGQQVWDTSERKEGREKGKGTMRGDRGEGEKLRLRLPAPRLARRGDRVLSSTAGAGGGGRRAGAYMGRSPAPSEAPGLGEEGPAGLPAPSTALHRRLGLRPSPDWPGRGVTSRGSVGSP